MEINNIVRLGYLMPQEEYTRKAGVSFPTTRNRIDRKLVAAIQIDEEWFIDVNQSPLDRNFIKNRQKTKMRAALPQGIDQNKLLLVVKYCTRKKSTVNRYYRAILTGDIFGLIIGDKVFAYKKDLDALYAQTPKRTSRRRHRP